MKKTTLPKFLAAVDAAFPPAAGEAAHTQSPLPWKFGTQTDSGLWIESAKQRGHLIAKVNNGNGLGDTLLAAEQESNAAFIVRACNGHAALLKASTLALYTLTAMGGHTARERDEAAAELRAALQLAQQ